MSRKLLLSLTLGPSLVLAFGACKSLTVQLGKKDKASETKAAHSADQSGRLYLSWNSMEDNLARLEELKKEGARAFLERYQDEGRVLFRSLFRQFRDSVVRNAHTEHNYGLSLLGSLAPGQCRILDNPQDLFAMEEYGDIRPLLETAVLSKLRASDVSQLNPSLPGSIDTVTKLVFFELGVKLDGASSFEKTDTHELIKADIAMQVVHEQDEAIDLQGPDERSFRFSFVHEAVADNQRLDLEAIVAKGIYDNAPEGTQDFLRMSYAKKRTWQALEVKNGWRVEGQPESLVYSRRIALYPESPNGQQFKLVDTIGYGMPDASSRSFRIDLEKREVCALTNGGKGPPPEENPGPGKDPDPKPDLPDQNDPGQNGDDPSQNQK
ncbi:hypothetical protein [Oligoflexus tunisiensis]|uniref:hypothetical protein n=1 Tax=Oligoflexus tunisiensis TaxID=708132 RepID=UPI00114CD250|nr:hypothetical protein [Oligoflexus tunisiensis]